MKNTLMTDFMVQDHKVLLTQQNIIIKNNHDNLFPFECLRLNVLYIYIFLEILSDIMIQALDDCALWACI